MTGSIPQQVDNTQKSKLAYALKPSCIILGDKFEKCMMQSAISYHGIYYKYYFNQRIEIVRKGTRVHTKYLQFFLGALPLFYKYYEAQIFQRFVLSLGNAVHFEHKDLGGISKEEALYLPVDKKQHMRHVYGMGAFIHRIAAENEQNYVHYNAQEEEFLSFYYQLRHGEKREFKDNLALKYRVLIEIGEDLLENYLLTNIKFIPDAVEQGLKDFRSKLAKLEDFDAFTAGSDVVDPGYEGDDGAGAINSDLDVLTSDTSEPLEEDADVSAIELSPVADNDVAAVQPKQPLQELTHRHPQRVQQKSLPPEDDTVDTSKAKVDPQSGLKQKTMNLLKLGMAKVSEIIKPASAVCVDVDGDLVDDTEPLLPRRDSASSSDGRMSDGSHESAGNPYALAKLVTTGAVVEVKEELPASQKVNDIQNTSSSLNCISDCPKDERNNPAHQMNVISPEISSPG